ncbi:MAG: hypothetical protein K2J07_01925 [Muribaculaceae bacterium]|nr:hypothetical protein [Muribaculaceae bacterium]
MLKRLSAILLAANICSLTSFACTSLIAARGTTADGAVLITYAADSHNLFGELYSQPAAKHKKGAMRKIYEWDTNKYLG